MDTDTDRQYNTIKSFITRAWSTSGPNLRHNIASRGKKTRTAKFCCRWYEDDKKPPCHTEAPCANTLQDRFLAHDERHAYTRFAFHSHLIFVFPIYSFSASLGINCQSKRCPLGTRRPYGITQCCLPPGSCDIPAITPAKLLIDLATPMGCKAELTPRIDNVHDRLNAANFRDFRFSSKFVITLTIKANQISGF